MAAEALISQLLASLGAGRVRQAAQPEDDLQSRLMASINQIVQNAPSRASAGPATPNRADPVMPQPRNADEAVVADWLKTPQSGAAPTPPGYQMGDLTAETASRAWEDTKRVAGMGGEATRSLLPEGWGEKLPDVAAKAGDYGLAGLTALLGGLNTGAAAVGEGVEGGMTALGVPQRWAPGGSAKTLANDLMAGLEVTGVGPEARALSMAADAAKPAVKAATGAFADDQFGGLDLNKLGMGHNGGPEMLDPPAKTGPSEYVQELLDSLPPEQRALIKDNDLDLFERMATTQDPDELAAMALAGGPKFGWYAAGADALKHVFGADTVPFTRLLAALSPQTSVQSNLQNAVNVWSNWTKAGRPKDPEVIKRIMGESVQGGKGMDSVLPAWVNNTITALTSDTPLSGPKVESFSGASAGDLDRVTLDAIQANASGVDQGLFASARKGPKNPSGFGPTYLAASAKMRGVAKKLAKDLGMDFAPSNVQETVWSWAKAAMERRVANGLGGKTVKQMVIDGDLTPEMINDVPDFATLIGEHADTLKGAGYGPQLESLAKLPPSGRRANADTIAKFTGGINQDHLLKAAERIDRLYDRRTNAARTGPYRPPVGGSGGTGGSGYSPTIGRGSGLVPVGDSGAVASQRFAPSEDFVKAYNWKPDPKGHAAFPAFNLLKDTPKSREYFVRKMAEAKASRPNGATVDVNAPKDYRGYKMFMSDDGTVGFSISPDGELGTVVSHRNSPHKGVGPGIAHLATEQGAEWLSAFDVGLPDAYGAAGFKPVARTPYNPAYRKPDWNDELYAPFNGGKPDVVFMSYDPEFSAHVPQRIGGKILGPDDYDKGVALARRTAAETKAAKRAKALEEATAKGLGMSIADYRRMVKRQGKPQ